MTRFGGIKTPSDHFRTDLHMHLRTFALAAVLVAGGCASMAPPPTCRVSDRDQAWIDRAINAWHFTSREITGIGRVPGFHAIFFSADCLMRSADALGGTDATRLTWSATPHDGNIALPDGSAIPAGVVSYVSGKRGLTYLVMSTPEVWEAARVGEGSSLDTMMIAVLLHEGSHVAQVGPYGPRLDALIDRYSLPDSFSDDSVQDRFRDNAEFAASVRRETELFLQAAAAEDDATARSLAGQARALMLERKQRWFTGADEYLAEAEDIWLTFEGAGQWTGYQWLVHPQGGAQPAAEVMAKFTRGRFWSQTEGFAVVMALDRLIGPRWKQHAFGDGARTVLEMLDDALQRITSQSGSCNQNQAGGHLRETAPRVPSAQRPRRIGPAPLLHS